MIDIAGAVIVEEMMMNLLPALDRNNEGFIYILWSILVLSDAPAIV